MVYAASVDLNDRNHMYCLEESRFITSEIVGIKLQMVHFVNFIQREVKFFVAYFVRRRIISSGLYSRYVET